MPVKVCFLCAKSSADDNGAGRRGEISKHVKGSEHITCSANASQHWHSIFNAHRHRTLLWSLGLYAGGLIDIHSTPLLSLCFSAVPSIVSCEHAPMIRTITLHHSVFPLPPPPPAYGSALFRPLHIYCVDGNTARGIYNIYIISHAWSWRSPKTLGLRRRTISRDVCFPSQIGIGMRASGEACCCLLLLALRKLTIGRPRTTSFYDHTAHPGAIHFRGNDRRTARITSN